MTKSSYKVYWSYSAKTNLKDIYGFIKQKSKQGAKNVLADIRKASKSLHFPEQT
ncbi:type II toxin-antitoxin system RelE/ParE family toxin [Algibacter sp. 2305UL17-15]|uniref:type II toxin-antitoxin system RelE/ParE family toxin n=1 Tax=Algibacter sp. 2305UL17-15 TaxID=3231268 RepID=UPI003459B59A